jgi:uncharacterized protein YfaP (DUF2135 family)
MLKVKGTVSDHSVNPVIVSINGSKYFIRTSSGNFSRSFPISSGKNNIEVIATNQSGTYSASKIVYGKVPAVPLKVILTSDTDGVYTDLHIYEAAAEGASEGSFGAHVYWSRTSSPTGGKFYLNADGGSYDQPGYGPYLYTHRAPPMGIYRIDANYWPSGDKAHTKANLDIILFAGSPNEMRRTVQYPLIKSGETKVLAYIKIEKNQVGHIYAPTSDKVIDRKVWPLWVE